MMAARSGELCDTVPVLETRLTILFRDHSNGRIRIVACGQD